MKKIFHKNSPFTLLILCLLPAVSLLILVYATKTWHMRFLQVAGFSKQCKHTHHASGYVRDSLTLAEMSAITSWTKKVQIYGLDYNFWSNAERKHIKCRKAKGAKYINCTAWAAPCRNIYKTGPQLAHR